MTIFHQGGANIETRRYRKQRDELNANVNELRKEAVQKIKNLRKKQEKEKPKSRRYMSKKKALPIADPTIQPPEPPKVKPSGKKDWIDQLPRHDSKRMAIEICSILPPAYAEANWLLDNTENDNFRILKNLIGESIPLAKWTINLLVQYKRQFTTDQVAGHGQFYKVGEDYSDEFKNAKRITESSDLSKFRTNVADYAEANTEKTEWILFHYMCKVKQMLDEVEGDVGNLYIFVDKCQDSAFRICSKLESYIELYGSSIIDRCAFDRKIPW